jgi:LPS export ABC transporter protein LptC
VIDRHHRTTVGAVGGLLVLALALGCSNGKQPPLAAHNPLADSADQVLYKTKSVLTDGGVMKAEVYGDTAYVFDDNTRVEMRGVRTIFFTVTGAKNAVLTSHQGTYNTRTNNMEARGDVIVVSEDGRRLTTPILRYSQARNEISSDTAFTLTDPAHVMIGIGFNSDPDMNNMRCFRACSGSAGTVNLPGGPADTARGTTPSRPPGASTVPPPSSGRPTAGMPNGAGAATQPGASAHAAATGRATGVVAPGGTSTPGSTALHPGPPSSAAALPTPAGSTDTTPPAAQPKASTPSSHPTP